MPARRRADLWRSADARYFNEQPQFLFLPSSRSPRDDFASSLPSFPLGRLRLGIFARVRGLEIRLSGSWTRHRRWPLRENVTWQVMVRWRRQGAAVARCRHCSMQNRLKEHAVAQAQLVMRALVGPFWVALGSGRRKVTVRRRRTNLREPFANPRIVPRNGIVSATRVEAAGIVFVQHLHTVAARLECGKQIQYRVVGRVQVPRSRILALLPVAISFEGLCPEAERQGTGCRYGDGDARVDRRC
jgi:hypothetical protein